MNVNTGGKTQKYIEKLEAINQYLEAINQYLKDVQDDLVSQRDTLEAHVSALESQATHKGTELMLAEARVAELENTAKFAADDCQSMSKEITRLNAVLRRCILHIHNSTARKDLIGPVADTYHYVKADILKEYARNRGESDE